MATRLHPLKLGGVRAQWKLLLTVAVAMVVVDVALYWLTSHLASLAA